VSERKRRGTKDIRSRSVVVNHIFRMLENDAESHIGGYPIRQQMQARAAIEHNLINSLDANDAAALRQWEGSAESFVAMLYDRCMRAHGGDDQACARYRE
jgi:hypothetical protein